MNSICGIIDLKKRGHNFFEVVGKMSEALSCRSKNNTTFAIGEGCVVNVGYNHNKNYPDQVITSEDGKITLLIIGKIFSISGYSHDTTEDKLQILFINELLRRYQINTLTMLNGVNGHFSVFIIDNNKNEIVCGRDYAGAGQLNYAIYENLFIFASESKAILEVPNFPRKLNLVALNQVVSLPGVVSPNTVFERIYSLEPGKLLFVDKDCSVKLVDYWNFSYSKENLLPEKVKEEEIIEEFNRLFTQAIKRRLGHGPTGFYLSGGLDSSMILGRAQQIMAIPLDSFSADFESNELSERKFQKTVVKSINTNNYSLTLNAQIIADRIQQTVYRSESMLKESYNVASIGLSELASQVGKKTILTGEGADELFGGYIGYRFDQFNESSGTKNKIPIHEENARLKYWGDRNFLYERSFENLLESKKLLYTDDVLKDLEHLEDQTFDVIDSKQLKGLGLFNRRSVIDFKVRMGDHLMGEHGDRMSFTSGVELLFPFLDLDIVYFALSVPNNIKMKNFEEKYILKKASYNYVTERIRKRPKFAFTSYGSHDILKATPELLSYISDDKIKNQNIFNPITVSRIKNNILEGNYKLNVPYDLDLMMIILTTLILIEKYKLD